MILQPLSSFVACIPRDPANCSGALVEERHTMTSIPLQALLWNMGKYSSAPVPTDSNTDGQRVNTNRIFVVCTIRSFVGRCLSCVVFTVHVAGEFQSCNLWQTICSHSCSCGDCRLFLMSFDSKPDMGSNYLPPATALSLRSI